MNSSYLDSQKYKKMLGIYIKEQRENLRLDPMEFSKKANISPLRLKKIEAGETALRKLTLEKLKGHLNIEESYLEKIKEVAKVSYVDKLYKLLESKSEQNDH